MKLPEIIRQLFHIFVMLTLLEKYLILVMVVWRLTHLICAEDGPFDLIIKLRKSLVIRFSVN